ncbi:MAG: hypothetical protein ABJ004_16885 [Cyclobacteriaceae bacterium]
MMKALNISFLLLLILGCQQQPKYIEVSTEQKGYKNFVLFNDSIIALGANNELVSIDPQRMVTPIARNIILINSINEGFAFVNSSNEINFNNSSGRISNPTPDSLEVAGLIQLPTKEVYIITNNAIINSATNDLFAFEDAPLTNDQIPIHSGIIPESLVLDMDGNIWVGFDYGEWGGELIVFNTSDRSFEKIELGEFDLNLCHVDNLTLTNSGILLSYGKGHGYNDGLIHFKNLKPDMVLDCKDSLVQFIHEGKQAERWDRGFEIGPVAYSPLNNKLYFYSDGRILSGELTQGMPDESYWKEEFTFYDFVEHGVGELDTLFGEVRFNPNIMIAKLALLDTTNFVFLTMNDGIGIIQNGNLTMYK